MTTRALIERSIRSNVRRDSTAYAVLRDAARGLDIATDALAQISPSTLRPAPRRIYLTLTANCNLRCFACHYGRDFMPGSQLPWSIGRTVIEDAKEAGIHAVRLYGGEPLLHRELDRYVEAIADAGMEMWLTTNALLLDKRIDRLHEAGLRRVSVGMYGLGAGYDAYVQRPGAFAAVERSIGRTRARHGPDEIRMHLDWLLMKPTCEPGVVRDTLAFAERHGMSIFVNLIHYSLPYFRSDPGDGRHHFLPEDRPMIDRAVDMLMEAKAKRPGLVLNSLHGLRSIPDWLILGPDMKVPCTERELIWVGADGTVQMCYVQFRLGNLHDTRLRDMLFTATHRQAARDSYNLKCPNCHCSYDARVRRHMPSRMRYGG